MTKQAGLQSPDLKLLIKIIWEIHTRRSELTELFISDEKGFLESSPTPFGWANLYSYSILDIVFMLLRVLEPGEKIVEEIKEQTSLDELQAVLDKYSDAEIADLGLGKEHSKYLFLAIWIALLRSLESIQVYGRSLNRLMEDIAHGSDKALFDAIKLDHTAIGNEHIQRRIAVAELKQDKKFFTRLANAMKQRPEKRTPALYPLRYILSLLHELGQLEHLSQIEAYELFCNELKLYSDKGEDGERSLWQFIYRWKIENVNPYST